MSVAIDVLKKLKKLGEATATQLGTTKGNLSPLVADGFLVEAGVAKTGKKGRPAVTFKLTKKGSDKVRRAK